ncbi:MAG: hypothetical protein IT423_08285 [Pirellulaceae bacterium]|nr:hypothetical protein [Pirellulaceae bacterium]
MFSRLLCLWLLPAAICSGLGAVASNQVYAQQRMTPELLWKLGRVGEAQLSPDGRYLAMTVTYFDLAENGGQTDLVVQELPQWLGEACDEATEQAVAFNTPLAKLNRPKTLLGAIKGLNSVNWINRPEGLRLVYLAPTKEDNPTSQAWMLDPAGGDPKQITKVEGGISNLKVAPTGDKIAYTIDVKMDATVNELYKDLPKADARIIDSLMYRHWNAWHDYAYSHVCVATLGEDGQAQAGVDLMKGLRADCPLQPFGGSEHFAFSPDGTELALTIKLVNNPAMSTDTSIFLVSAAGGPLKNITPGMPG